MEEPKKIISFDHVGKVYEPLGTVALTDVNFSMTEGEFTCLVGPSGDGKSTILKLIAGLEAPTSGTIIKPARVAVAFQSAALLPWLSVFENVALGLRAQHMPEKKIAEIVRTHIAMVDLQGLEHKRPPELSGGQAQRVGIARALAVDPDVLLLDEPFSALDPKTTAELHDDLLKIWRETHKTILMVSHVIEEAVSLGGKVILIKGGRVAHEYPITLPYPRREQGEAFLHDIQKIRKEFFADTNVTNNTGE